MRGRSPRGNFGRADPQNTRFLKGNQVVSHTVGTVSARRLRWRGDFEHTSQLQPAGQDVTAGEWLLLVRIAARNLARRRRGARSSLMAHALTTLHCTVMSAELSRGSGGPVKSGSGSAAEWPHIEVALLLARPPLEH